MRVLNREGAAPRVSGLFSKAVVQAVMLYRVETWVGTPCMGKYRGGVHTQVASRLTGRLPQRTLDGRWRYNLAGFLTMEEYIRRQQNTVAQYIAMR